MSTYIFGFRNVTGLTEAQAFAQKNKAQHSAPMFWTNEGDEFHVELTNVGLALRPDLFDAHTVHWHGFKNVIAFFDGEPTGSIAIPAGQSFTYVYKSHDPGTYMYHCHVEDVEHVQMGMTGLVFVRPIQDDDGDARNIGLTRPANKPFSGFAYNCGDGSTGFHREFGLFLSEIWAEAHWADAHIQLPEWSDYRADFSMLNGRVYPDTLLAHSPMDAITPGQPFLPVSRDPGGDLVIPPDRPDLQYQPTSSLVTCEAGEDVLLRFANLGFKEVAMTLTGIKLRVVGRDATLLRGRTGADASYASNTLAFGAGESFDTIFTAPPHSGGSGPDRYVLFNRTYTRADNLVGPVVAVASAPRSMSIRPARCSRSCSRTIGVCDVRDDQGGAPAVPAPNAVRTWVVVLLATTLALGATLWARAVHPIRAATESNNRVGIACTSAAATARRSR